MLGEIKNILLIVYFSFILAGCSAITSSQIFSTASWFTFDSVVEAETGKSVTDTIISKITGKDCELKNLFIKENDLCKEVIINEWYW